LTDRTRVIRDTVNMKSRKTFARMHVGFVNINASRAKCSLVAASRL
jgi:phosphoglycerate dehydrogenase-like enzyme